MSRYQAAVRVPDGSRAGCLLERNAIVNSDERRAARRARRDEQRAEKRSKRLEGCDLENVASLDSLCDAANKAANSIRWKASVQRYHLDPLGNAVKMRDKLMRGEDIHGGFVRFTVNERGKLRNIAAVKFPERVVQKSANQNAFMPSVRDSLIYDNSANVKGKGTKFAVDRMKRHLVEHYRKHGREGYILLGDFKGFFASIPHEGAKALVRRSLDDDALVAFICSQIDHEDGDRGLPLGSEINQTIAVAYPNRIDHFVVECGEVEAYGRYMDDFYAIHTSKEHLQLILACIESFAIQLGLTLNANKTHIVKLSHGFTYLKRKFSYGENGKIVVRPTREAVTRERRRLKRQARLVADGVMTFEEAQLSYLSWRSHVLDMDSHELVGRMDALFWELFGSCACSEDPPEARIGSFDHIPTETTPRSPRGFLLPEND